MRQQIPVHWAIIAHQGLGLQPYFRVPLGFTGLQLASPIHLAVDLVLLAIIHQHWVLHQVQLANFVLRGKRIQLSVLKVMKLAFLAPPICTVRLELRLALPLAPLETSTL